MERSIDDTALVLRRLNYASRQSAIAPLFCVATACCVFVAALSLDNLHLDNKPQGPRG
jgi:hypothetical protein